jgi:nitrile hydratase
MWLAGAVHGIHDLGGMQGFGPVDAEPDEPVFHEPWEGRMFGLAGGALGAGGFNTPMFRHAIERMDPGHYLTSSYYEHWLTGVTTVLVEAGLVDQEELERRAGTFPLSRPVAVSGDTIDVTPPPASPRYTVGDAVRVRTLDFAGHTRCPSYVFGRRGTIVALEEPAPIPEVEAHRKEKLLETIYAVRFDGRELWGDGAEPGAVVHVDLYERYLERG